MEQQPIKALPEKPVSLTKTDKVICVVANIIKGAVVGGALAYAGGKANELIGVGDKVAHQAIIGALLGAIIGLIFGALSWVGAGWRTGLKEGLFWTLIGACIGAAIWVVPPLIKPAIIWMTGGWQEGLIPAIVGGIIGAIAGLVIGLIKAREVPKA